jgi:hypothetical protein
MDTKVAEDFVRLGLYEEVDREAAEVAEVVRIEFLPTRRAGLLHPATNGMRCWSCKGSTSTSTGTGAGAGTGIGTSTAEKDGTSDAQCQCRERRGAATASRLATSRA